MKTYLIFSIISIVLLSGCGSVAPVVTKPISPALKPVVSKVKSEKIVVQAKKTEIIKPEKVSTPTIKKSYQPDWIMNPSRDGHICNIGFATLSGNLAITKKIATIDAKANISQDIQSYIKSQIELETHCRNQECKEKFSSKINITSTQMIRDVKTLNQYTDTKESIYYIHLCSKI